MTEATKPSGGKPWLPIVILVLGILYLGSAFRPQSNGTEFDLVGFGRLPVIDQGRVKPLDTYARTSLMVLSNKQTLFMGEGVATSERKHPEGLEKTAAINWLLDVVTRPEQARQYTMMRVDHPDILGLLGVQEERQYFSIAEMVENAEVLGAQFDMVQQTATSEMTGYQRQVLKLSNGFSLYVSLEGLMGWLVVPPSDGSENWLTLQAASHAGHDHASGDHTTPAGTFEYDYQVALRSAFDAYALNDPTRFNAAVASCTSLLETTGYPTLGKHSFESYFNHVAPFVRTMALYVLVFVLAAFSWLGMSRPLARAALWVLILAVIMHTFGLTARTWVQGRPPVTNLYSSAIFVGWGASLLGMFLERMFRSGIGAATAASMGFLTLLVAHHLSLSGDTMTMMQAVLDTNFWLATHVTVITLGYSATYLAGFLGIIFILRGVLTKSVSFDEGKNLSRMIYGIVAFATLFSFVGTILGGIWADQSWGRFWGWDPKENGALLIVLWNALVLHARWGGLVRQRGIASLAVAGNIITSWSWFGTNMLGVGLHAYGFIDSAVFWMAVFVTSQLAIIGIGSLPMRFWRSPVFEKPRREATTV